jgi:hypothetical protein
VGDSLGCWFCCFVGCLSVGAHGRWPSDVSRSRIDGVQRRMQRASSLLGDLRRELERGCA